MLCPFCKEKDTSVVDSRPTEDGTAIRRRRLCGCERKERFTTFERVQFQELTVIKGSGKRAPFDRDKIAKSIRISLRKRPVESDNIEKFISKILKELAKNPENNSKAEKEVQKEVIDLCGSFPIYSRL